jgi:hypothetical protein
LTRENRMNPPDFAPDDSNEMFQLALQLISHSNRNIFLTGKAGTGKTTFLKHISRTCPKQLAVVAPTGVAAINAGGVTIHSFFQLPFSPFIPETNGSSTPVNTQEISNKHSLLSRLRLNSDKKKVLQELELLVIDEISMVRCDLLDALDTVLRHVRHRPRQRFGGVQVLFIGDMLQLPPVAKEEEWQLLSKYYDSPYFFDSKVLKEEPPLYIEFSKIYRQKDDSFISVLNQVRNNKLDESGRNILQSRVQPGFQRHKDDGYIVLTTHNYKANEINAGELAALETDLFTYDAEIENDFSENSFPVEKKLQLKIGAQVMFTRNDTAEKGKRYFNGKIGIVSELTRDKITVDCDGTPIQVSKEKWENIRYTLNKTTRKIESDVLGSFTQFPLRLAWAITIHKSQGLTFEKAIIDAGEAFASGQVYVALSRCSSLEGMILQTRIKESSLYTDPRIVSFSERSFSEDTIREELERGRNAYERTILLDCFDFNAAVNYCKELTDHILEHRTSFNAISFDWSAELIKKLTGLEETAKKFRTQLGSLFPEKDLDNDRALLTRVNEAASYFMGELQSIQRVIQSCPIVTDAYTHARPCNDLLRDLNAEIASREYTLKSIKDGFTLSVYQEKKKGFTVPSFNVNVYAGSAKAYSNKDLTQPELHQQLRKLRDSICAKKNTPIYMVAGTQTLYEMARYLPQDLDELSKISGFGKARIEKFGQQFLDIILDHTATNGLSSLIHEKSPKRIRKERSGPPKKKGETYITSFNLYKEGKPVNEIAKERNLAITTIQSHLATFVQTGEINIEDLVSQDKINRIENALNKYPGTKLTELKQKLGDDIDYGEIRFVMASKGIEVRSE